MAQCSRFANQPREHAPFDSNKLPIEQGIQAFNRHILKSDVLESRRFLHLRCAHRSVPVRAAKYSSPTKANQACDSKCCLGKSVLIAWKPDCRMGSQSSPHRAKKSAVQPRSQPKGTKLALCARNGDLLNQVAEEALNLHGVEVYTDTLDVAEMIAWANSSRLFTAGQPSIIIALLTCS
jgi:hypothetical protein